MSAQNIKDEVGKLLGEAGLFRSRWVRVVDTLLHTKSVKLDPAIVDGVTE